MKLFLASVVLGLAAFVSSGCGGKAPPKCCCDCGCLETKACECEACCCKCGCAETGECGCK